ncbi:DsbA family oxidoreductase [Niveispirillum sp.]|uniref:DsbA family oxidoreductase n=1 Tax=Niveispirillum sp. TaxID=1917217 RepID=UPI001B596C39|nr:DsbA family oxidoreductase [Niveispirillum sp.]MBP7339194.1 DsbA family oxidoreductase [Niveispirillum sp.]
MLIEIYSDLICPWCFLGKVRLDRALGERPRVRVDIRWMPFQLNPELPADGMDRDLYFTAKFGGPERARQMNAVVEQAAAREGLLLRMDLIRRIPSTLQAHRMVRFAERFGKATDMAMALFAAYFQQGRDIGNLTTLVRIAAELGLDAVEATDYLIGDADMAAVRGSDTQARQLGVQAVPCYIFDRRYALAGAQEHTAFLPMLDLARTELVG